MKFCAVIAEYNPFHNGHKYQLERIRQASGCEKVLCLMSGDFTQRGEVAVLGKYTRARHAVENGADVVLELPAAFAVSPAELFARGAVHILTSLPAVETLAFGCESGTAEQFLRTAKATLCEDKQFKAALKENMKDGVSYIRARNQALLSLNSDIDETLLTAPNNILGTEYCRALLSGGSKIIPLPIPRVGAGYADSSRLKNFSSATALRACILDGPQKDKKFLKGNMPYSVLQDVLGAQPVPYKQALMCALVSAPLEKIAACPDCSEGLENRLTALAKSNPAYDELLAKAVSKRYTLSRLKRIILQNFLNLRLKDVKAFAEEPLYCKVLAVKKEGAEKTLSALNEGKYPVLVRRSDANALKKEALACFETDVRASELYNALSAKHVNEFQTLFV